MASANAQVSVAESQRPTDLDRLESAIRNLIGLKDSLQADNADLAKSLDESRLQLDEAAAMNRDLQERLLVDGQLRQDALKRIDDLVGLIEQLDPTLSPSSSLSSSSSSSSSSDESDGSGSSGQG